MESISKVLATSFGGYSLEHILSAVITLLVCLLAVRLIMRAVEKLMGRIKQPNERLSRITVNFIKALLYLLTVIITAGALGLNTSSITAIASVLTLGLTLATQDIMSNVAGGLIILSTHPFSIGDVIESDGTVGTVRDISLNHHAHRDRRRADHPPAEPQPLRLQDHQLYHAWPPPYRPDYRRIL